MDVILFIGKTRISIFSVCQNYEKKRFAGFAFGGFYFDE